jgi:hypothetical protein
MNKQQHFQKIFDLADLFQLSAILFFANKENIFDLLVEKQTFELIAQYKNWIPWKTKVILDSLVAMELIKKEGIYYQNFQFTTLALSKKSKDYIGDLLEHERLQWKVWSKIENILVSEDITQEQQEIRLENDEYANHVFNSAMAQLSNDLIDYVLNLSDWHDKNYVIDIAGGHGVYLAKLIQKYPQISGEIWDLSTSKDYAIKVINDFNLSHKIKFVEKDITLKESYSNIRCNGILINHCLHHFLDNQVMDIFNYVFNILDEGGIISIIEPYLDENCIEPKSNVIFSAYMMINRQYGKLHDSLWIEHKLKDIGFKVETKQLNNLENDIMFIARK